MKYWTRLAGRSRYSRTVAGWRRTYRVTSRKALKFIDNQFIIWKFIIMILKSLKVRQWQFVSWGRIGLQITTKTLRDGVLLRKFRRIQNFRLLQCHIWSTCLAEFNVLCLTVSLRTKYKSEHKFAVPPCKIICFLSSEWAQQKSFRYKEFLKIIFRAPFVKALASCPLIWRSAKARKIIYRNSSQCKLI